MNNYKTLICLLTCLWHVTLISTLPLDLTKINNNIKNASTTLNQTLIQTNNDVKSFNKTDSLTSASAYSKTQKLHFPITMKPRGFHVPKLRPADSRQDSAQPAAQNFYSAFFPQTPSLDSSQPYYPLNEEPFVAKLLAQQFEQRSQNPLTNFDAAILGSGDFGILKGGTFYADDESSPYDVGNEEEASDLYYGEHSYAGHGGPSTESFIQKYTHPEEQFAQFRDFADLSSPVDTEFSQYVVIYAAKNSTQRQMNDSKPKNIFEQLQEIDKEKALEAKKLKKNNTNLSITKLKLVRTKLAKKKITKKQQETNQDDDPLMALS